MSVLRWSQDRITKLTDLVNSNLAFLWVTPSVHTLEDITSHSSNLGMNFTAAWLCVVTWHPVHLSPGEITILTRIPHSFLWACLANSKIQPQKEPLLSHHAVIHQCCDTIMEKLFFTVDSTACYF